MGILLDLVINLNWSPQKGCKIQRFVLFVLWLKCLLLCFLFCELTRLGSAQKTCMELCNHYWDDDL